MVLINTGCKPKQEELKWSEEKTVEILADLRIIDNQIKKHKQHQKDSVKTHYLDLLLEIHKLKKEELESQVRLVQSDPVRAKYFETKVQNLLNERLDVYD